MKATVPKTAPFSVVIVDDDDDARRLLRFNLSIDRHFNVVADVNGGQEGLEVTLEARPDLLVLDLMMPGINGAEVLQKIRERCPHTKVAMFTAATIGVAASLTAYGADLYVAKTEVITEVVEKLLRLASGEITRPAPPPSGVVVRLPQH